MNLEDLKRHYKDYIVNIFNRNIGNKININNFEGSIVADSETIDEFSDNLNTLINTINDCIDKFEILKSDLVELKEMKEQLYEE